jgi:signal transduction histidine kinase
MLDDFGLQPALEWHVRDFSRRFGVPVELTVDGDFDLLPEQHRTCVYRSVQEALTNCVRHARASRIAVSVSRLADGLAVTVADDGVGFNPAQRAGGLGLRGIEERVRDLHGVLTIRSAAGAGTTLTMKVPLSKDPVEVTHARAAG